MDGNLYGAAFLQKRVQARDRTATTSQLLASRRSLGGGEKGERVTHQPF